ncbi:MAG: hypothetical protein CM15mP84_08380 [Cellvibrionales bacterium]|nr:MAG: hypothetical protein CM15mP84_08380 [Cellvibrionales bacterium]
MAWSFLLMVSSRRCRFYSLDLIITLCQGDSVSWAALEQSDSALGEFLQRTDALVASDEY